MACVLMIPVFPVMAGDDPLSQATDLRGSDPLAAVDVLDEGLATDLPAGERVELLLFRGQILRDLQSMNRAQADALAAHELAETLADPELLGRALRLKGTLAAESGDLAEALGYFLDAREILRDTGPNPHLARVVLAIGIAFSRIEEWDQAEPYLREALLLGRELEDRAIEFSALSQLAQALEALEHFEEAMDYHREALTLAHAEGAPAAVVNARASICRPLVRADRRKEAEDVCSAALDDMEALGRGRFRPTVLLGLAELSRARGQSDQAIALLEEAAEQASTSAPGVQRDVLPLLADLYEERGDHEAALATLRDYLTLRERLIDESRRRALMAREVQYQLDEREREIELLSLDQELAELTLQRRNWMLLGMGLAMVVLFMLAVLVWRFYQARAHRSEALAGRDPLTGLLNRRGFDLLVERECAQARREGYPITLVVADIDHFKGINDSHGHGVGDQVLKALVARLHEGVRGFDSVVRWGGEEFLMLFPRASQDEVMQIVERLRDVIARHPIDTDAGPLNLTLTFGVASLRTTIDDAIQRADRALYRGKAGGRNRVELAD